MSTIWSSLVSKQRQADADRESDFAKRELIYQSLIPKAKQLWDDPSPFKSGLAPRRSSKSYTATSLALGTCLEGPGKRALILSLTLKAVKENYWTSAPGGVQMFDRKFGLNLEYNYQDVYWTHPNGSQGFLAGAATADDLEKLRGSKVEADIVIIDECKSFSFDRLLQLITEIVMPGLMTRGGTLVLMGTPGKIKSGIFFAATHRDSRDSAGNPTCVPYDMRDAPEYLKYKYRDDAPAEDVVWSSHTWGIKDNTSNPKQWQRALLIKKMNNWDDNHPTWLSEFMGQWVDDSSELVYAYLSQRLLGKKVTWRPDCVGKLPGEGWSYMCGIDLGFEDDTAVTAAAYNHRDGILRHIETVKVPHLNTDQALELAMDFNARYSPEIMVMDAGGLGKMIMETFAAHGLPVVAADKKNKNDYIELLNSDLMAERILVAEDSELHHEMSALSWDLSRGDKKALARANKLHESKDQPNHACDSFLYLWRWAQSRYWNRVVEVKKELSIQELNAIEVARIEEEIDRRRRLRPDPNKRFSFRNLRGKLWNYRS